MIRLTDHARALLAVLSVFVMGIVAGCTLDRTILAPPNAATAAEHSRVPRDHDAVLAELVAELGLSAEQSAQVGEIFAGHHGELETTWAKVHASLDHAMRNATTEIEAVLDSAQVERLHAWLAKRHGPTPHHAPGPEH